MCHISFILSIFTKNIQNNVSERLQTMHVPRKCTKMAMINQKKIGSQACGTESTHQSLTYEVSVCLSQQFLFFNAIARDSAKPRENTVRDLYRALYKRQFSKKYLCFPLRPSFFKKCLKRKVNISAYRTLCLTRLWNRLPTRLTVGSWDIQFYSGLEGFGRLRHWGLVTSISIEYVGFSLKFHSFYWWSFTLARGKLLLKSWPSRFVVGS